MFNRVTNQYLHALAHVYHKIDRRGLMMDVPRLDKLRQEVISEISDLCRQLSNNWSMLVYVGTIQPKLLSTYSTSVNINSSSGSNSLLATLKKLGYDVPSVRKKNKDKEWEMRESADELALQKMFAETGDINLKHLMRVKELTKLLGTYINAKLHRSIFYSSYGVANTVTGRRGCSKHPFGYGGNAQTFPSHTTDRFTHDFRRCVVSRPGCVFFSVDQKSAEEHPQAALAGNIQWLKELHSTEWPENDRHTRRASFIFNVPITTHTKKEWKDVSTPAGMLRYMGKKCGHAFAYKMQGNRMSEVLAKEGYSFTKQACDVLLEKTHNFDPSVENVYHAFIRSELETKHMLVSPLGRERQFLGLRPNSDNYEVMKEGYAWIPQSVVGDNTGMAVLYIEIESGLHYIVNEAHDSIGQEVPDNLPELERVFIETEKAFKRPIVFQHNGIEINIPIEAKLSYNFEDEVSLSDYSIESLQEAYKELKDKYGCSGVSQPPTSVVASSQIVTAI